MSDCGTCSKKDNCATEDKEKCTQNESFLLQTNELNDIKKVIPVISGKGGVGKSLVTALMAVMLRRKGFKVGILDADITGPSIPKMFGLSGKRATADQSGIYPVKTHNDIKILSINLLLESDDQPVIWRGPLIAGAVKQFWTDAVWGELDYLLVDMPPGTGDVPLTIFQSLPVDGIVVVTSPQDLVALIVQKAINMAKAMKVPVLGVVENMSYIKCPDCDKKIDIFGKSNIEKTCADNNTRLLAKIPLDEKIAELCDKGQIERYDIKNFSDFTESLV